MLQANSLSPTKSTRPNAGKDRSETLFDHPKTSEPTMPSAATSSSPLRRLRKKLRKSPKSPEPSPESSAISHPFDISTNGSRPLPVSSAHFRRSSDPNGRPEERQKDRIAKLIELMQASGDDVMQGAFPESPEDLEMRIELLQESGVDPLKDLVDFYSKRKRYANSMPVWGGWLVEGESTAQSKSAVSASNDVRRESDDSLESWFSNDSEDFSSFLNVAAPYFPMPPDHDTNESKQLMMHVSHRLSPIEE